FGAFDLRAIDFGFWSPGYSERLVPGFGSIMKVLSDVRACRIYVADVSNVIVTMSMARGFK
ncbi:hypothetical protein U1Q18_032251, partial [Sarracenia purpurea var. burkii]